MSDVKGMVISARDAEEAESISYSDDDLIGVGKPYLVDVAGARGGHFQALVVFSKDHGYSIAEVTEKIRATVSAQARDEFGDDDYCVKWTVGQVAGLPKPDGAS